MTPQDASSLGHVCNHFARGAHSPGRRQMGWGALAQNGGPLPVGLWAPWTSQATLDRLSAAINARFVRSWACQHLARQCNYTKLDLWWLVRDPPSAGAVAPPPAALPPADAVAKPAQPTLITP